jgi:hypothetical protein
MRLPSIKTSAGPRMSMQSFLGPPDLAVTQDESIAGVVDDDGIHVGVLCVENEPLHHDVAVSDPQYDLRRGHDDLGARRRPERDRSGRSAVPAGLERLFVGSGGDGHHVAGLSGLEPVLNRAKGRTSAAVPGAPRGYEPLVGGGAARRRDEDNDNRDGGARAHPNLDSHGGPSIPLAARWDPSRFE